MPRLAAGLLRDENHLCLVCAAPAGTCWCSGLPTNPRHDDGATVPIARLLRGTRAGA